jgi:glycosyltransferase involved in cell wall biosynthesis
MEQGVLMRILHINNTYKNIGGAETYISLITDKFKEKGHDLYYFAIDEEKEVVSNSLLVYRDKYKRGIKKYIYWFFLNPFIYHKLKKFIEKVDPDIIHVHNNGKFSSSVVFAIKSAKCPVIQTVHDLSIICPISDCIMKNGKECNGGFSIKCVKNHCISNFRYLYELFPNRIKLFLMKSVIKKFIAPSKSLYEKMINNGFRNIEYISHFVDLKEWKFNNMKLNQLKNITYVGRLSKAKGISYLINAMPAIISKFPDTHLNIIGTGPEELYFKKIIDDLNLTDNVTMRGRLDGEKLKIVFKNADIIVIPSISMETGPIVLFEAMASGCPVVGSNIGGIPDLIEEGKNGYLVTPGSSNEIAERVIHMFSNPMHTRTMFFNLRNCCNRGKGIVTIISNNQSSMPSDNVFYNSSEFEWPLLFYQQKGFFLLCESLFLLHTPLNRLTYPLVLYHSLLIVTQFSQMVQGQGEAVDCRLY